jgi:hypothetical protein
MVRIGLSKYRALIINLHKNGENQATLTLTALAINRLSFLSQLQHLIDNPILYSLCGTHKVVSFRVAFDTL